MIKLFNILYLDMTPPRNVIVTLNMIDMVVFLKSLLMVLDENFSKNADGIGKNVVDNLIDSWPPLLYR